MALKREQGHANEGFSPEDFVYGAIDGTVTTFAVVAGVVGASLAPVIVVILGMANLLADGFSMAIGNYMAARAKREYFEKEVRREEWEIDNMRKAEVGEIRDIYRQKGFKGRLLEQVVKVITSDRKVWVDTMMREELNMTLENKKPLASAASTFLSFNFVGLIPVAPFILMMVPGFPLSGEDAFLYSVASTAAAFFIVGMVKGRMVKSSALKSGLGTLLIGGLAAAVAYVVGFLLSGLAA